MIFLSEITC